MKELIKTNLNKFYTRAKITNLNDFVFTINEIDPREGLTPDVSDYK